MTRTVDLPPADLIILRQVLHDLLPPTAGVWVFGSRATGSARRYSDLDLALQDNTPIDPAMLANLSDELSESDLTIKVDLVDLLAVDPPFRRIIESEMLRLPPDPPRE